MRETKGDLFPLVDQCRRAVAWTYRNAAKFGGDPERLYLCSRSSGSHLAGCVVITDWDKMGVPRTVLKGAVMGSGMYDLKPVRHVGALEIRRSSPTRWSTSCRRSAISTGCIRRWCSPSARWRRPNSSASRATLRPRVTKAGKPVEVIVGQHYNHFEVGDTIGHPVSAHRPRADEDDEPVDGRVGRGETA